MANEYLTEILEELEAADEAERAVLMKQEEWDDEDEVDEDEEQQDASEGQRIKYRVVAYNQEVISLLGCYEDFADAIEHFEGLSSAVDNNFYEAVEVERVVLSLKGEVMQIRTEYRAVSDEFMAEMDREVEVVELV